MKSIQVSHLRAVSRAIHFVRSGITKNMTPKLIDSIEKDIRLLEELHVFCCQQIKEPGLPMVQEPIDVGDIGEDHGNSPTLPPN